MGFRERFQRFRKRIQRGRKDEGGGGELVLQDLDAIGPINGKMGAMGNQRAAGQPDYAVPAVAKPRNNMVYALCDFITTQPGECSFVMGDLLLVLDDNADWWRARNQRTEAIGLIPANYVTTELGVSDVLSAWYDIDRSEAESMLSMLGAEEGTFILRPRGMLIFRLTHHIPLCCMSPSPYKSWSSGPLRKLYHRNDIFSSLGW